MTALGILATGACTAVGLASAPAAAAVRSAISGFGEYDRARDRLGEPAIVAAPPGVEGVDDPAEAISHMATAALSQIAEGAELPVYLALPEARPGLPEDLGHVVSAAIAKDTPGVRVAPAKGGGHAGFAVALQQARAHIEHDPEAVIAVIGADSYLCPDTIAWLDSHRQLHALYNAWGFIPGGAAGALLVCRPERARALGRPLRALIEAVAIEQEDVPIKTDGVCLGRAMSRVVEKVLDGQPEGAVFDGFYCDQNGEAYRADEIGFMLARASGRFRDPAAFVAPADCWGDVGAASLPLFVALAIEASDRGYAAGPVSLHLAGSESGLRAGLRVRTPMRSA